MGTRSIFVGHQRYNLGHASTSSVRGQAALDNGHGLFAENPPPNLATLLILSPIFSLISAHFAAARCPPLQTCRCPNPPNSLPPASPHKLAAARLPQKIAPASPTNSPRLASPKVAATSKVRCIPAPRIDWGQVRRKFCLAASSEVWRGAAPWLVAGD
uniref:Uncharacterized protein n=1 Tax=Saccharum spontaneum TaxID=62335 RepID=A0A678TL47_SACSP|nr:hypothetical protein SS80F19_000014 [Saccharum spontaneum]